MGSTLDYRLSDEVGVVLGQLTASQHLALDSVTVSEGFVGGLARRTGLLQLHIFGYQMPRRMTDANFRGLGARQALRGLLLASTEVLYLHLHLQHESLSMTSMTVRDSHEKT